MKSKRSSFRDIYEVLIVLAKFLKANHEYYYHQPRINEALKRDDSSVMDKYDRANRKYHNEADQAWKRLDIHTRVEAVRLGHIMPSNDLKDIHCYHPNTFRSFIDGLKQVGMECPHAGTTYLAKHYPLMIKSWPKSWFTDFGRAYQDKRRKQYQCRHPTITPAREKAMHEPNAMGYAPNKPAVMSPDYANVKMLTKMGNSQLHEIKSQSSAIVHLSRSLSYLSSLASNAMSIADYYSGKADQYESLTADAVRSDVSESMSASSAISKAHSNEAPAEMNATSAFNASQSASHAEELQRSSLEHPSVSEASDNLIDAVQSSMKANHDK